jgi:hypothetical protein
VGHPGEGVGRGLPASSDPGSDHRSSAFNICITFKCRIHIKLNVIKISI